MIFMWDDGEPKKTVPKTQTVRDNLTMVLKVPLPVDGQWSLEATKEHIKGLPSFSCESLGHHHEDPYGCFISETEGERICAWILFGIGAMFFFFLPEEEDGTKTECVTKIQHFPTHFEYHSSKLKINTLHFVTNFLPASLIKLLSSISLFLFLLITSLLPSSSSPLPFVTAETEPFNPDYAFNIRVDTIQLELTKRVHVCVLQCSAGCGYKHICLVWVLWLASRRCVWVSVLF